MKDPTQMDRFAAAKGILGALRTLRADGWQNDISRMGGAGDPSKATAFGANARLHDTTLAALYADNALAKRIVRELPASCFRRGVDVGFSRPGGKYAGDEQKRLKARLVELDLFGNFVEGVSMARLFGGALLVAGLNDGNPSDAPLDIERLQSVPHLTVIDRRYAIPVEWYDAPGDEYLTTYGTPKIYALFAPNASGRGRTEYARVHASRTIRFDGAPTTLERRINNLGWGDSVFQSLYDILVDDANTWGSVNRLIGEAAQGVMRIKGLIAALASKDGRSAMTARADYFDLMRNIARTIFLDADSGEDYRRDQITFSGLSDLLDKHMLRVCSAAEYPATVLYGRSPAGLAATGENELKQYNVRLRSAQESYVPNVTKLVSWVIAAKDFGTTQGLEIAVTFPSLWDLTDKEASEKRKLDAEADKLKLDSEVYLPEEVALARAESDGIPIDRTVREKILRAEYADPIKPEPKPEKPEHGEPKPEKPEEPEDDA